MSGIKHPDRHEWQRLSQKRLTEVHLIHPREEKRQRWTEEWRDIKESPAERRKGEQELKKQSKLLQTNQKGNICYFWVQFNLNKYLVLYGKCDGETANLTPKTVQYVHVIIITSISTTTINNYI